MSEIERESDFADAVRERGIVEWLRDEAPAEPETPAGDSQPRDERGRFASAQAEEDVSAAPVEESAAVEDSTEEEVSADAGTEEESESEDGDVVLEIDDEELLEYLDKYDGDILKALKAASDAQKLIGRQSNELGELRALKQGQESLQEELARLRMSQSYDWDTLIEESPGDAAKMAVEIRDPVLFEKAMEAWGEQSPFAAMMFMSELSAQAADEAVQQQQGQPTDLASEMAALQERHPDLNEMLPEIQKLAAERPLMAQALAPGGDPRLRVQALGDLYELAKSRTNASDTSRVARQIILRAKAEADAAVADAEVVSATNTQVETPPPSGVDQFKDWFREATGQPSED